MAAAAARLVPALGQAGVAATYARVVPAAPDGLPLLGCVPGFEEGRVMVAIGEMQHALGFARAGAPPRELLACFAVTLRLTRLVCTRSAPLADWRVGDGGVAAAAEPVAQVRC